MIYRKQFLALVILGLAILIIIACIVTPTLAQGLGAAPFPYHKPPVDQLGEMTGVASSGKIVLALGLTLQAIALVAVAVALASHLSLPKNNK